MSRILPVNLSDLLHARTVESERIEFKGSWDPDSTGHQVLRTICAFANDYHRLNGGYVVIGVAEREGRAALPPRGLESADVEAAQRWISGRCKQIRPPYQPILSPEVVEGRHVLVVWAPGSDVGGHRAPEGPKGSSWHYWIRLGSDTVDAERAGVLTALLEQARRTPFDDSLAREATIEDLRASKVREHLRQAGSDLLEEPEAHRIFRRMRIVGAANGYLVPRNVGLLLFSSDPGEWFRGARIEVARFRRRPGRRCPGCAELQGRSRRAGPRRADIPRQPVRHPGQEERGPARGLRVAALSRRCRPRGPGQRRLSQELPGGRAGSDQGERLPGSHGDRQLPRAGSGNPAEALRRRRRTPRGQSAQSAHRGIPEGAAPCRTAV